MDMNLGALGKAGLPNQVIQAAEPLDPGLQKHTHHQPDL
jgi:hypothetical protein